MPQIKLKNKQVYKFNNISMVVVLCVFFVQLTYGQVVRETSRWRALIAIGVNSPSSSGFVDGADAKSLNLPTVNLGLQHMLKPEYGVRLDFGFNRFNNASDAPSFKANYTRINAQFVYDPSQYLKFLSPRMQFLAHAGPGYSSVKPLGGLGANKQSYLNLLGGLEFHYTISRKIALFTDVSYIYGLTSLDNYDPSISGLGAFNGNVITVTFGVSIALSGCYTCN